MISPSGPSRLSTTWCGSPLSPMPRYSPADRTRAGCWNGDRPGNGGKRSTRPPRPVETTSRSCRPAEPSQIADVHRSDLDAAAALLEQLEQRRLIDAVVDRQARVGEVAGELEALRLVRDRVPVALDRRRGVVPQVGAELALPRPRAVVVDDGVDQAAPAHLLRGPLGVQRRLDTALLEQEGEVEASRTRTDDSDLRHELPPSGVVWSSAATSSAARSPIIVVAACVLPEGTVGMIDASATRRPVTP